MCLTKSAAEPHGHLSVSSCLLIGVYSPLFLSPHPPLSPQHAVLLYFHRYFCCLRHSLDDGSTEERNYSPPARSKGRAHSWKRSPNSHFTPLALLYRSREEIRCVPSFSIGMWAPTVIDCKAMLCILAYLGSRSSFSVPTKPSKKPS